MARPGIRIPGRAAGIVALAALVAAVAWFVSRRVLVLDAPEPRLLPDVEDTLPALPVSVVEAPVTYDLDTAIDSLEAAVPRDYGDLDHRIVTAKNRRVSFAYRLHRSRFRVRVQGQTVTLSADVEYSGKVWYKPPLAPEIQLACGVGEDPPRRATMTLESTADLTPAWGVRTHSRLVGLAARSDSARDQCRLTFLRIDITPKVFDLTRRYVDEKLGLFDDAVARWPARRWFERIWRDLRKPLRLADSVYMTMDPSAAEVGDLGAHGDTGFVNLRLIVAPKVRSGARPTPDSLSLPPLT